MSHVRVFCAQPQTQQPSRRHPFLYIIILDLLLLIFFFFFFFWWVREAALQTDTSKLLYQGPAPTREPTCSLELSLPSPAGIWFKTPSPVGGTKTASQGIGFPKESAAQSFRGRECGGRPWRQTPREYPLNLQGASCPTWAR